MKEKRNKDGGKKSYILTRETLGMTFLLFSAIIFLTLLTGSAVFAGIGKAICTFMYGVFGYGSLIVTVLLAYFGEWLTFEKKIKISIKKAVTVSLTVFSLFLLFHAVSTRGYAMNGYGAYIADCYKNAQNGYAGYTFGGVFSAIFVYPVAKAGGFVTAYVVFSVLTLLFGYLVFLAFNGAKIIPRKKSVESAKETPSEAIPVKYESPEPVNTVGEMNSGYASYGQLPTQPVAPVVTEQPAANVDVYSQKNLGRKILFEKGEFAAESYRRNMIFNENSYFNHPVSAEDDYLKSFSLPNKDKNKTAEVKSYTENYQQEIYNRPVGSMPASYVYGEKPVENLPVDSPAVNYAATTEPAESYPEIYQPADEYDGYDEVVNEQSSFTQPAFEQPSEPEVPFVPPVRERGAVGFSDSSDSSSAEAYRGAVEEPEKEDSDEIFGILSGDSTRGERKPNIRERGRSNSELFDDEKEEVNEVFTRRTPQPIEPRGVVRAPEPEKTAPKPEEKKEEKPKHIWKKYVRPTLDLLDNYPENANVNTGEIEDNKRIIVETLDRFKIACDVANVTIGPAITRYDVVIEDKTKITQALKYREAVAMALRKDNVNAYLNYSRGAISIEIPNNQRAIVGLKNMLASPKFINSKTNSLTFALGKNVEGEVVCPDITKMPHLLVAGTTGSGKSICLSALLVSLLYKYGPEELRLILVDPKQVEFISYDKLPHLMINEILYECDKAIKALNWAIKEMERRYSLFKDMTEAGTATKNLDEYNAHLPQGEEKLPKIVIVLDEFGDLMLQAKKDIESRIIKLVQKARACGIHLILATQRPSVDCITGLIKSNLPTRIGFKVNSFDDARTIFDIGGAEKLLGKGDSYFRSAENPDLTRIQCCFVDTHEVQKVTDFVKAHNETYFDETVSDFINTVEQEETPQTALGGDGGEEMETKIDDTFIKALKYCVTSNQASVSMIQRRFPVGYIKACKIIDWIENMNYVTPSEGSKPRKVLLSREEFFNIYGDIDD